MAIKEPDLHHARWRKSSYSNGSGGNCIEVAEGFAGAPKWRKSSHSNGDGGHCLEVADNATGGLVPVRDSKNPAGPALVIPAAAWSAFVSAVKSAAFSPRGAR
ncbi:MULTISPECIES: DUF397 domain-containing protein [Streptomyces]|uniref:DUF397 domain-containing protein n=1 Tax=Streptomyces siderophoricus TaxID=2802281 RepID=A0ABS1N280_9ACTN|nr:DUF397 domain-containing protein [Streptomyces sp. 9-7]MBL1094171.1 DUF397 domain-containing protein [Streptomyces sp. 9-7]